MSLAQLGESSDRPAECLHTVRLHAYGFTEPARYISRTCLVGRVAGLDPCMLSCPGLLMGAGAGSGAGSGAFSVGLHTLSPDLGCRCEILKAVGNFLLD